MPKISKNTILKYIPQKITVEKQTNPLRIYDFNQKPLLKGALPLLVHAPASSYAALFEFMETYGILDMISGGFSQ